MKQKLLSYQANTAVSEDQPRITAVLLPARIRKTLLAFSWFSKEGKRSCCDK
jgi:hypothetical protein